MKSKLLRLAIAVAMLALLVLYARRVDWSAIARSTADASFALLALSALCNIPLIWLKALRLRLLVGERIAVPRLMGFYVASYAADNLVMSQAGVGVRVALLRKDGVPLASAVTSQAVEKVLEALGLAILAVPVLATLELEPRLESSLRWFAIGGGIVVALAVAAAIIWRRKLRVMQRLADVLATLRDPILAAKLVALSLAAWVVVALWALRVSVPELVGPTLVLLAVNVAALVPGLPANVGPFEAMCVVALATFGIDADRALGFALVYHALHTIPVTLVGLPLLHRATRAVV